MTRALAKRDQTNSSPGEPLISPNQAKPEWGTGGMSTTELPFELAKDYPKQPKTPQKGFSCSLQQQKACGGCDSLVQRNWTEVPYQRGAEGTKPQRLHVSQGQLFAGDDATCISLS